MEAEFLSGMNKNGVSYKVILIDRYVILDIDDNLSVYERELFMNVLEQFYRKKKFH